MATSGSINFSMTARDVIRYALEELRILAAGEDPTAEDADVLKRRLNLMLKSWQMTGPNLWRQTEANVTLVASTAGYVLSPRPHRVIEARYRDAYSRDLPMLELTRQEYLDLPLKSSTGIPTSYYVDYQRTAASIYVWPVLASVTVAPPELGGASDVIRYSYQRTPEDIDTLDDDLDVPQEYLETIGLALADRCQSLFGKDDKALTLRSRELLAIADIADREAFVQFVPDRRR